MVKMGRKSLREESLMADVINLSWRTIYNVLRSDTVEEKRKEEISLEIVKKSCPKEVNLGAANGRHIKLVWEIDGTKTEITPQPRKSLAGRKQV